MSAATSKRHPVLAAYLHALQTHPVRTKALTSALLQFASDAVANQLAGVRPAAGKGASATAQALAVVRADATSLKLGLYGALVAGPLGHLLSSALARAFAGRTSARARLGMLLANNLLVAPINTVGSSQ